MGHASTLMIGLLVATALSGCIGDGDEQTDETIEPSGADGVAQTPVPAPIEAEETVAVSASVISDAGLVGPCGAPTVQCFRYPFELVNTTEISAEIVWQVPLNDFDLYVFEGDSVAADSVNPPPGTSESLTEELGAGSYEIVVAAYLVVQGTFVLNATFQPA